MKEQPLVRVQEACALLSVNEKTLRLMISRGTLDAVRLGPKTTRFRKEDIDNLVTPDTPFAVARREVYALLNAAVDAGDLNAIRSANTANKWLSCARDDKARGQSGAAKVSLSYAGRALPNCAALAAYGDTL